MIQKTVLVLRERGRDQIAESTFGTYRDQYLWNLAWCHEFYHTSPARVPKNTRTWFGTVTPDGIARLKALGWRIEPAHIVLGIT